MQPIRVIKSSMTVTYDVTGEPDCTADYMNKAIRPTEAVVEVWADGGTAVRVTGMQVKKDGSAGAVEATHAFHNGGRSSRPAWIERLAQDAVRVHRVAVAAAK